MKTAAGILALAASAQAGQYMINQLAGKCVNVGSSRCTAVSCSSGSADQFQVQNQQIVVYGQENTCLVARNPNSKYVYATSCDSPAAERCQWQWNDQQLVNTYEKCLTMQCNGNGKYGRKCWLVQTECAPAPAPAAPAPAVYQYQSQCWDLNNRYQNSNYYSPTPVAPVYQPQAPAYQPQAPAYQPQEPVYGWQKPTNPQYGWNKPGYGPKPKPVYGDDDEVDSFPSNAGYQAQARPSYY